MAIISRPSNSITPDYFGTVWGSVSDPNYCVTHSRTFPQPDHLKTKEIKYGYEVFVDIFAINNSSAGSFALRSKHSINDDEVYFFWGLNAGYLTGWQNGGDTGLECNSKKAPGYPDNTGSVKNNDSVVSISGTGSVLVDNQMVVASHVRYDNGKEDSSEEYEVFPYRDSSTGRWTPTDENESCSAYSLRVCGSQNNNRIVNQTRGCYTVLFLASESGPRMTLNHVDKSFYSDPDRSFGGYPPSSEALDRLRKSFLNGLNFRRHGNIFHGNGSPALPGAGFTSDYYIIYPSLTYPGDNDTFGMAINVSTWASNSYASYIAPVWDGSPRNSIKTYSGVNQVTVPADPPKGPSWWDYRSVAGTQNAFGPFSWSKYSLSANVASIAAYTVPEPIETVRTYGKVAGRDYNLNLKDDSFNIGQPLRGTGAQFDSNGSIGIILNDQNSSTYGLVAHTSQCVFSWGSLAGLFAVGSTGSLAYKNIFNSFVVNTVTYDTTIPVISRKWSSSTNPKIDMAIVGEWNADTRIKVTTSIGSYTLTMSSDQFTTAGNYLTDTIEIDPDGDTLTVEAYVSDSKAINIRTISFFETRSI